MSEKLSEKLRKDEYIPDLINQVEGIEFEAVMDKQYKNKVIGLFRALDEPYENFNRMYINVQHIKYPKQITRVFFDWWINPSPRRGRVMN